AFGFAAGLPQIIKAAGSKWLLTQKISWSQTNTFPHHTFLWEGIDGTRIFTHFPPVDTYNCSMQAREIAHAARNFKEKGRATRSLAPTGWGDGGGGTTREMIARAARMRDLEGSPKVAWERPADFFAKAQAEYANPAVWVGELYLELHRATLTSQAKTKQGNRRSEHLLREAELWAATAAVRTDYEYPAADLDRLWKTVLLHQFHDILPGSSIAWVHREAERTYTRVAAELSAIIERAQWALGGERSGPHVFNPAPHAWNGIPAGGAGPAAPGRDCTVTERSGGGFWLANTRTRVEVDARGLVVSVYDLEQQRETLPPGATANLLQLHQDYPNSWDAWDVDQFYRNTVTDLTDVDFLAAETDSPTEAAIRVGRSFGSSTVEQLLTLRADTGALEITTMVDWYETEKFLKLAFPLDIHADRYASETQFGHLYRPTHTNTSWEYAKFEACNHRFIHVAEPGWGAALVNDSTYGHDLTRTVRADGGTTVTVRASLLRAPRFPDPHTDHGAHHFRHALLPGASITDAVRAGYRINLPPVTPGVAEPVAPLFSVDNDDVVTSAVKLADDGSGDVVVRLYEAAGGRATAVLTPGFTFTGYRCCDLLERPLPEEMVAESTDGGILLRLRPFQLVTLRFSR
ncbi:alpha-mannosidase, partial [Nocardia tengchongensis]|uniref:alpha-mannosidase n=1 Tax=Nocardia tengchongensis TaxID=2055889 RepID=UPI0036A8E4AC